MKIVINESQLNSVLTLLTEGNREDKARENTIKVIIDYFNRWRGMPASTGWMDKIFDHPDNPTEYKCKDCGYTSIDKFHFCPRCGSVNVQKKRRTILEYIFWQFEENFFHDSKLKASQIVRFEPAFADMALEMGFQQGGMTKNLGRLGKIIWKMYHFSKQSEANAKFIQKMKCTYENGHLNSVSYQDLENTFGKMIDNDEANEEKQIKETNFQQNNEYTVLGPLKFRQVHEYAEYSGDKEHINTKICYGMFKATWDDYTYSNTSNVYILLRKGWENIEPTPVRFDERNKKIYPDALDEYGTSMIFVIVNGNNIEFCNSRYNHVGSYRPGFSVDHAMSRMEISQLLGRNFFDALPYLGPRIYINKNGEKYYDDEDTKEVEITINTEELQEKLDNGAQPEKLFDECSEKVNGYMRVKYRGKFNYMNPNNKILSRDWFENGTEFFETDKYPGGVEAGVNVRERGCIIDGNGTLHNVDVDHWKEINLKKQEREKLHTEEIQQRINNGESLEDIFDNCTERVNGYMRVSYRGKINYLNDRNVIISNTWFDDGTPIYLKNNFPGGIVVGVTIEDKAYLMDGEGNLSDVDVEEWANKGRQGRQNESRLIEIVENVVYENKNKVEEIRKKFKHLII